MSSGLSGGSNVMIGSVGTLANGFVLLALLCARQSRRKNINVFIINQTFLDLLSCLFLIFTIVVNDFETTSIAVKWIICLLFKTKTIVAVVSYSSIFGLVVITVERYVKVVHPVAHRNHYRRWMTYAGVILPWVDGVCCYLIPAWATASMVDGKCLTFQWPTPAMFTAYTLTMFLLHYVLPPAVFFFAYYRIVGNICHLLAVRVRLLRITSSNNQLTSLTTLTVLRQVTTTSTYSNQHTKPRRSSSPTAESSASLLASRASLLPVSTQ